MPALIALILAAPLLYLPGWVLARALTNSDEAADPFERIFERVLLGMLLNGWLALILAEIGIFSIWLQIVILSLICVAAWRLRPALFGALLAPKRASFNIRRAFFREHWDSIALTLILFIFAIGVAARPFEVVLGVRDAGVYANTGFAIARTGGIVQHDPIVAAIETDQQSSDPVVRDAAAQAETNFLSVQPRQRTIATRLRQAGFFINDGDMASGRVVPQGFHLFPAWIALLTGLGGMQSGLAATGLLGLLGIWSVAMLGRRLAGPWVGLGAAVLLALNGVQIWFSRYSTAEVIAQFLTFAGLYCFAAMNDRRLSNQTPTNSSPSFYLQRSAFVALLAGLAIGQLALARIDFFLVVLPVVLYLFYLWFTRRWASSQTWLGLGLAAMLIHAAVHITTIARAYFFDTLFARLQDYALTALIALPFLTQPLRDLYLLRPCSAIAIQPCPPVAGMPPTIFTEWNYRRIFSEVAIVLVAILAVFALRRWGQPLIAHIERLITRSSRILLVLGACTIGLLGFYAYLIRPQILSSATLAAVPSCLSPTQLRMPQGACLALQGYVGAPIESPAYVDSLAAWLDGIPRRILGRLAPSPTACAAFRSGFLPPSADGRTSVELRAAGITSEPVIGKENWDTLQACDRVVLRDLFANSQPNLVRIGWYLSPLGILLGMIGLALWWRRMNAASWLFLTVTLIAALFFIRLTYGTSDQHFIYILRRYIPQVYPAFCLGIAYALAFLAHQANRLTPAGVRSQESGVRSSGRSRGADDSTRKPTTIPRLRSILALVLGCILVIFNIATNLKIDTHTEYAGAIQQIGAIAAHFRTDDIVLLRGGAPTYASARDIPDNLATPLTYGFGLNALTIKSAQPGNYVNSLAAYVRHWQSQGRQIYLIAGASGAFALPGYTLEMVGPAQLNLHEFEQLTSQKPSNIQDYVLDMRIYRFVPTQTLPMPTLIAPDDYATQVGGFYRTEQFGGTTLAWTNGDAALRLPWPSKPTTLTVRLAVGTTRPSSLGPLQVCLSYRPEPTLWPEDPNAPPFSQPACYKITAEPSDYTISIDPQNSPTPAGGTLLLRIQSSTWIPARDDPAQRDQRRLGVLFGGVAVR